MTKRILLLGVLLFAGLAFGQGRVYELRTYTANDGKLEALKARFRDHGLTIFKNHGIESIGYWVRQDPEGSRNTLIYIVAHASREQATKNWAAFDADPDWIKVKADSEVNGALVQKIVSVFMDPTDFSPLK